MFESGSKLGRSFRAQLLVQAARPLHDRRHACLYAVAKPGPWRRRDGGRGGFVSVAGRPRGSACGGPGSGLPAQARPRIFSSVFLWATLERCLVHPHVAASCFVVCDPCTIAIFDARYVDDNLIVLVAKSGDCATSTDQCVHAVQEEIG